MSSAVAGGANLFIQLELLLQQAQYVHVLKLCAPYNAYKQTVPPAAAEATAAQTSFPLQQLSLYHNLRTIYHNICNVLQGIG